MGITLAVSGGIHAFVVGEHVRVWWLSGVFFLVVAVAQAGCAYRLVRHARPHAAKVGALLSALLIVVWVASRTIGIPFGPDAGQPESVGAFDLISVAAELATVTLYLVSSVHRARRLPAVGISRFAAVAVVALALGMGAATGTVLPEHAHAYDELPPDHGGTDPSDGAVGLRSDAIAVRVSGGHSDHAGGGHSHDHAVGE